MTGRLIATQRFEYGARRLEAGEEFDPLPGDDEAVRVLVILGVAKDAPAHIDDAPWQDYELDALRARYLEKFGRECDRRWGARRIKAAIEETE